MFVYELINLIIYTHMSVSVGGCVVAHPRKPTITDVNGNKGKYMYM